MWLQTLPIDKWILIPRSPSPQPAARWWWAGWAAAAVAHLARERSTTQMCKRRKPRPSANLHKHFRELIRNEELTQHRNFDWKLCLKEYYAIFIILSYLNRLEKEIICISNRNNFTMFKKQFQNKSNIVYSIILLPLLLEKTFWNNVYAMHSSY